MTPTYVYQREDGSTFEAHQRMSDPAYHICPETGQPCERVLQPAQANFRRKGTPTFHSRAPRTYKSSPSMKDKP